MSSSAGADPPPPLPPAGAAAESDVSVGRERSSGSDVRLPVRTTRLMLVAAIVVASFRSFFGSSASLDTATAASGAREGDVRHGRCEEVANDGFFLTAAAARQAAG